MRLNRFASERIDLPRIDLLDDFTVEGVFKVDERGLSTVFVGQWDGVNGYLLYRDSSDRLNGFVNGTSILGPVGHANLVGIVPHHYAWTKSGTVGTLYLDGDVVASGVVPASAFSAANARIGTYIGSSASLVGAANDVRFWNVARTQEQIRRGMAGITGREDGLVAWYPLELDVKDYATKATPREAWDDFSAPDGTPLLDRVSPSGHVWQGIAPITTRIYDGVVIAAQGISILPFLETGAADVDVSFSAVSGAMNPTVVFRRIDGSNRWEWIPFSGLLRKFVAGSATTVLSGLGTGGALDGSARVVAVRDRIDVYFGRLLRGSAVDATHRYATQHGFGLSNTGGAGANTYDGFRATPLGPVPPLDGVAVGSPRLPLALR